MRKETLRKRKEVFYKKAIEKAKAEIGNNSRLQILTTTKLMIVILIKNTIEFMLKLNVNVVKFLLPISC